MFLFWGVIYVKFFFLLNYRHEFCPTNLMASITLCHHHGLASIMQSLPLPVPLLCIVTTHHNFASAVLLPPLFPLHCHLCLFHTDSIASVLYQLNNQFLYLWSNTTFANSNEHYHPHCMPFTTTTAPLVSWEKDDWFQAMPRLCSVLEKLILSLVIDVPDIQNKIPIMKLYILLFWT